MTATAARQSLRLPCPHLERSLCTVRGAPLQCMCDRLHTPPRTVLIIMPHAYRLTHLEVPVYDGGVQVGKAARNVLGNVQHLEGGGEGGAGTGDEARWRRTRGRPRVERGNRGTAVSLCWGGIMGATEHKYSTHSYLVRVGNRTPTAADQFCTVRGLQSSPWLAGTPGRHLYAASQYMSLRHGTPQAPHRVQRQLAALPRVY